MEAQDLLTRIRVTTLDLSACQEVGTANRGLKGQSSGNCIAECADNVLHVFNKRMCIREEEGRLDFDFS